MNQSDKNYKIHVEAQIDVEIDGQPAYLNGHGDQLQLILGHEEALYPMLNSSTVASQLADVLDDLGLTLTVTDEQQPLLKIGHDVSSRLSGVVTGSRHIAPASLHALIKLLRGYLGSRKTRAHSNFQN